MGNPWLSKAEFEAALKELGFNDLPIGRMFELFDQNGDVKIYCRKFLTNLVTLRDSGEGVRNDGKICYEEMNKCKVEIDGIYKQRSVRKK